MRQVNKTFVIAEAGVNHNGDLALARALVDVAVAAGADAVKFQTFVVDRLVTRGAATAEYQQRALGGEPSQYEMLAAPRAVGRRPRDALRPTARPAASSSCPPRSIRRAPTS